MPWKRGLHLDVLKYASRYQYCALGTLLEVLHILCVVLCAGTLMLYREGGSSVSRKAH